MQTPRDEIVGATVLGRYRIVARLAKGGMGVVYLARAEGAAGFVKPVVVKRVLPDLTGDARMARLFVREAKILANLQHPNIVSVIDFGEEEDAYIMVLDYVRAYHLGLWLSYRQAEASAGHGDRLPVEGVVHIMIKVLDALDFAHTLALPDGTALEIVHSDISPANILVDGDGQVKLLDFGIARMRGEQTQTTDSKSIRGKLSYLPIEALDGSPPTIATDVYACGVTLYELLAGENPYTGSDETRTIARVISHEPPSIAEVRPGVSPELAALVQRAMSKDRSKRFASAKEFARELRKVQTMPEDEAARALAAVAKADFAALPVAEGFSLTALEEAWRNPSPSLRASEPKIRAAAAAAAVTATTAPSSLAFAEAPTQIGSSSPEMLAKVAAHVEASRKKSRALVIAFAIAGLVAIGVAAVALVMVFRKPAESAEPKFVLIERTTNVQDASSPSQTQGVIDPPPPPPIEDAAAATTTTTTTASTTKPTKPAGGDPLSAAFAKNQPEIESCFRDKAQSGGTPDMSVRFSIDKDGVVQRAELTPADLTTAPLGQCILGVARRTKFPPQAAPATFHIPLRARKSG